MSNLLTSLAYIKTNVDAGISIWKSLAILTLNVIKENKISDVSTEALCKAFNTRYNINIPIHPMNTIIGKIRQMGFIDVSGGKWQMKISQIENLDINTINTARYENLISDLQNYVNNYFKLEKTLEDIENIFIGFINFYDSDILFSLETKSVLPEFEISNAEKYMIGSYIESLVRDNSSHLETLNDIMLANIHVNSIFFVEKSRKLKLNKLVVYLDTRIVLRLTGIEGEFRKEEYQNLLQILFDNKCNLRIFAIHYSEVITILDDCVHFLERKENYNPKYASRALRYFVEHNCSVSDVLQFTANLDTIFKRFKIGIDEHNYDNKVLDQYNIEENELFDIIIHLYHESRKHFEDHDVETMVWNDVKAISSIYRKRKGFIANMLENVGAILITNNRTLSIAVREYNKKRNIFEKYSECVTDTYWGTAIWLNTAYKETSFYKKKIIADSIMITKMNPKLKEKFITQVEEMRRREDINENEYYVLKEYPKVHDYIKDASFNDEEEYDDSLPEEALEHFKEEAKKPLESIIAEKTASLNLKENEMSILQKRQDQQKELIDKMAKRTSILAMISFALIVNIPSIVLIFVDFISSKNWKLVIRVSSLILGFIISIEGFSRISVGKTIYKERLKQLSKKWGLDN